jgi:hypothetical protein
MHVALHRIAVHHAAVASQNNLVILSSLGSRKDSLGLPPRGLLQRHTQHFSQQRTRGISISIHWPPAAALLQLQLAPGDAPGQSLLPQAAQQRAALAPCLRRALVLRTRSSTRLLLNSARHRRGDI